MKRIIDLTYPIRAGMAVWPGDPAVEFTKTGTIAESGFNTTLITMGTHTGTHTDSPRHVMHDDRGVDCYPMESLMGWAEVLDMGELKPRAEITSADFDKFAKRVPEGGKILLKTGWGKRWGQPEFYTDFPGISEGAVAWLQARKIKLLGLEQPSVNTQLNRQIHKGLLVSGMVLLETLGNMQDLQAERVYLVALPMKLAGIDGAPTRVIAIEGMDDPE